MMKPRYLISTALIAVVYCLVSGSPIQAEEKDGWVDLFNGKDLTGWDVLTCEVDVQDGALLLAGGNGLVQTKEQYTNFILDLEWKALKPDNWDSGIYFRYTKVPPKRPWPARYQANIRKGHGRQRGRTGRSDQHRPDQAG